MTPGAIAQAIPGASVGAIFWASWLLVGYYVVGLGLAGTLVALNQKPAPVLRTL